MSEGKQPKKADQYNDPKHNYLEYWKGREYEHLAEEKAMRRLLKNKHFAAAADVGGGYGRLCVFLENFADKVTLAEPSKQQLDIAKDFLKGHPEIERKLTQADNLDFSDKSLDLVTMIRVMHHLPDPKTEFSEIYRVLKPGGHAVIEVANYAHLKNRLKYLSKFKKLPTQPVDIRSKSNQREDEIAFVNHNPKTVITQFKTAGFVVEDALSVSNLRSPRLKKILPKNLMAEVDSLLQKPLARIYFGPSIFFLLRKPQ